MSVTIEAVEGVDWVRLDRPTVRNAIDHEVLDGLESALDAEPTVLVIASTSDVFSAGADLGLADEDRARLSDRLYGLYRRMRTTATVVVGCANGAAVGGGAQLLIACDIRVVGPGFWCRFVGPGHGLVVGAWALPSLVGRGRALAWAFEQSRIDADKALAAGLVDLLDPDPQARTRSLVAAIAAFDPDVVGRWKQVAEVTEDLAALDVERQGNDGWSGTVGPTSR